MEFPQFASKKGNMFDSFGFEGFKEFVIQDNQNIISKIFHGVEKFDKKDNKITLVTLKFSVPEYKKLKNSDKLYKTTVDLLHLTNEYGKKYRLRSEVMVHLVDNLLQVLEKDTCGMYQIYFYGNLFNPLDNSSILSEKNLNKRTIERLCNEILLTDRQENERKIEAFAQENNISQNEVLIKTCLISFTELVNFRIVNLLTIELVNFNLLTCEFSRR